MGTRCPNLATCGFFKSYFANRETIKTAWIQLYCEDQAKWGACERKKLKDATGRMPPDNMAPTGRLLQSAASEAPRRRS